MNALDAILDAQAVNDLEAQRLFNPTTEPDSLLEYIEALPMPDRTRAVLRGCASSIVQLNDRERACERDAACALDGVIPTSLRDTIGVRGAAVVLRPVLRRTNLVTETRTVRRLLADPRCGIRVLGAPSMEGQLGRRQYDRLMEILDALEARDV